VGPKGELDHISEQANYPHISMATEVSSSVYEVISVYKEILLSVL
jgi:hypothetical protein